MIRNPENKSEVVAKVKFSNDRVYPLPGEINFINSGIDEGTGTIKLRAVFPNPKKRLKPGQFLRLVMEGLTRVNALIVPQEAIMQGANGSYVYMVESVNIQTGLMTKEGGWIVDSGLKAGDRVIVSNLMKIRPGMTVDPKNVEQPAERETVEE